MADLLILNANVITMDPRCPKAEAVAVRDGRILAVGPGNDLEGWRDRRTEVMDLKGRTLLPGFIDAHIHLGALAESLVTLNVGPSGGVASIEDVRQAIYNEAKQLPPGTWIRAGGYDETRLAEGRDPDRRDLDPVSMNHPVKLTHRSGHAHVLNSLGLKLAGISGDTPEPEGSIIERDLETGEPTGLLYGLGDYLEARIPPLDEDLLETGVKLADRELLSSGLTSVQDASHRNDFERWRRMAGWKEKGLLTPRVSMMFGWDGIKDYSTARFASSVEAGHLKLGAIKIIIDETTGRLSPSQAELNEMVLTIHRAGLQAALHAIEDTAVEAACTALEYALGEFPRPDHRHRIEHCSICPPRLAARIASLGGLVVTHPSFVYFSGKRYLETVPPGQLEYLYPLSTLIKNGVRIAAGSDAPICPVNPPSGIYGAVTRRADSGDPVLAGEKIAVDEALRMYTVSAAAASFEEGIKGAIAPGKLADFAVLSADPMKVSEDEIKDIRMEMTILGGRAVWTG